MLLREHMTSDKGAKEMKKLLEILEVVPELKYFENIFWFNDEEEEL